jgi:hypothetical protein
MFPLLTSLSVAMAVCAVIAAMGRRHVAALCGFSSALLANADAFTLTGHRNVPDAIALVSCAAALLVTAFAVAMRNRAAWRASVRDAHAVSCPECGPVEDEVA